MAPKVTQAKLGKYIFSTLYSIFDLILPEKTNSQLKFAKVKVPPMVIYNLCGQ